LLFAALVMAGGFLLADQSRTATVLRDEATLRANVLFSAVRESLPPGSDPGRRHALLAVFSVEPDVRLLALVDADDLRVVDAAAGAQPGDRLAAHLGSGATGALVSALAVGDGRYHSADGSIHALRLPRNGAEPPRAIVAVLDTAGAAARHAVATSEALLVMAFVLVVCVVIACLVVEHLVLRPVERLRAVAERRAGGDASARVRIDGDDELALLARSFDAMLDQLDREQQRVRDAAEHRRQSDDMLALALYGAGMGTWTLDVESGRLDVDARWLAMLDAGTPAPSDLAAAEASIHADDLPRVRDALRRHLEDATVDYECELRIGRGDGWCWVLDRGRVVARAGDGKPRRMAGTRQDIDARKRAEVSMLESERLVSVILDNLPMPTFLKDRDSRFLVVNAAYERFYGVSAERLLGHTAAGQHDASAAAQFEREDAQVVAARRAMNWDTQEVAADGSLRHVSVTKFPVFDEQGEVIAVGGLTIDQSDRVQAAAAIRASEQRLRSLTANLPGAVYRAVATEPPDACREWRLLYASEGIEEMFGASRAPLQGGRGGLHAFVHPDDRERVLEALRASARDGVAFDLEYRLCGNGNDVRWVNDRGRGGIDEDIGTVWIDGMLLDVTARKLTEHELDSQRTLFAAVYQGVPDPLCIVDRDRRVLMLNPAFEQEFGYTADEARGRSSRLLYPDDEQWRQQGDELFNDSLRTARTTRVCRFRRKDGSVFRGETVASPIVDAAGEVLGYVSVVRDVTERERAEQALRESEQRFRKLADDAPLSIFTCDRRGVVDYANRAYRELLGLPEAEQPGSWLEHVDDADRAVVRRNLQAALASGTGFTVSCRCTNAEGDERWLSATAVPPSCARVESISAARASNSAPKPAAPAAPSAYSGARPSMTKSAP
ncbi:MAG: PAS domain S-box protein, partial [Planctomycetes bacterium]|nr:PAS domain S-box protein [Planctomycetota bacterium]